MLGEIFYIKSWEIIGAFLLDFLIGDPAFIPHPVVAIGKFIEKAEEIGIYVEKIGKIGGDSIKINEENYVKLDESVA